MSPSSVYTWINSGLTPLFTENLHSNQRDRTQTNLTQNLGANPPLFPLNECQNSTAPPKWLTQLSGTYAPIDVTLALTTPL